MSRPELIDLLPELMEAPLSSLALLMEEYYCTDEYPLAEYQDVTLMGQYVMRLTLSPNSYTSTVYCWIVGPSLAACVRLVAKPCEEYQCDEITAFRGNVKNPEELLFAKLRNKSDIIAYAGSNGFEIVPAEGLTLGSFI